MQESDDPRPGSNVGNDQPAGKQERAAEATGSETLAEIESEEKIPAAGRSGSAGRLSPDGQFDDEPAGREDAGPR